MRDKRFVAVHRGGVLDRKRHNQLIRWAHDCARHVLKLFGENIDKRLLDALKVARAWEKGDASVGDARKAAFGAIAAANESSDPAVIAAARAVGHVVATAHMADHAPGSADYCLRAVKAAGKSVEKERKWQDEHLPEEIRELVLSFRKIRHLKI